jgi:transcriptional regulator with XRE-family HTH domain
MAEMTLDEYLCLTGMSLAAFSERSGLQRSTISRLRHARRRPTIEQVEAIERATSGAVRAQDFYGKTLLPTGGQRRDDRAESRRSLRERPLAHRPAKASE